MLRIVCLIIMCMVVFSLHYVKQNKMTISNEQDREEMVIESLERALALESQRADSLEKKKQMSNSDENIEEIAREQFGFIKSGEIVIKPNKK